MDLGAEENAYSFNDILKLNNLVTERTVFQFREEQLFRTTRVAGEYNQRATNDYEGKYFQIKKLELKAGFVTKEVL